MLVAPAGASGPPYELRPAIRPDGSTPGFVTTWDDGRLYVIPKDVLTHIGTRLDRELFNVTGLVEMGYDDRSTDRIPLILSTSAGAAAPPLAVVRAVPSLDLVAAEDDRLGVGSALDHGADE